ncbi:MAG: hypothetical protein KDB57_10595 [Solirubrobacterales bacterium]|nr:hypothetical protein [Solirubrobacterales bacterium]
MKKIRIIAATLVCMAVWSLTTIQGAEAGTFTMKQCQGAGQIDFQAIFTPINGSDLFDVTNGCSSTGSGKIGIYQDKSGPSMDFGDGGQFRWDAPSGTSVIGADFAVRLKDANGLVAGLVGFDGNAVRDLDGGIAHDGEKYGSTWTGPSTPQSMVVARLKCDLTSCLNTSAVTKAYMEVTDAEFTVLDSAAPTAVASGELWNWGGDSLYHRGSSSIRIDSSDQGSGIAAAWVEVNGLRVDLAAPACPGDRGAYSTRFTPCPLSHSATRTFDTSLAPFQEGPNSIRLCARDYASTEAGAAKSCTASRTILVDNRPSGPPANLGTDEGTGWRPVNGFTLRWEIPAGQNAPVIGAVYLLYDADTGDQVDSGFFSGNGVVSAGPVQVPGVGAYRAVVYLVDGATNLGEPAETMLRFDDRPPGNVAPQPPEGWISKDELPLEQEIEKAVPGGPSGIAGYALAVSSDGPVKPCETIVCLAPEITLSQGAEQRTSSIGGLAEGSHWISATAVSGAHKSSLEPGSTEVKVDRTPPESVISGVPNEWVNHPVTVTVESTDEKSGMLPAANDDGQPATIIDAEDYAPYIVPGPIATFAVATEGVNRVRYWAEDLAGNLNDGLPGPDGDLHAAPGQAVVKIDLTPPESGFDTFRDPDDPELVRLSADDADSGVARAEILIRRAGGGGEFFPLDTTARGRWFEARVPSDDLPPGAYELKAVVTDRAGNESSDQTYLGGSPAILNLPLKEPVVLTASFHNGKRSFRAPYATTQFIEGRLTSNGEALTNQPVRIVESYVPGASSGTRETEVLTDRDGRYRVKLGGGPGRSVTASFAGTRKLSRVASSAASLHVRGRIGLRIKPRKVFNGGVIRMRGSVGFAGALPPARGKIVAIQYFDPSRRKWRPVEVLRTSRLGLFSYRYRFRTITSPQRILFRASALPEAGWPYLPSTSKPRSVIVYPKD